MCYYHCLVNVAVVTKFNSYCPRENAGGFNTILLNKETDFYLGNLFKISIILAAFYKGSPIETIYNDFFLQV